MSEHFRRPQSQAFECFTNLWQISFTGFRYRQPARLAFEQGRAQMCLK